MFEQIFRRSLVRARIDSNPLGPTIREYVTYLVDRGHRAGTLHQYVFAIEHLGRWLQGRPVEVGAVDRFIARHLPRCTCGKPAPCDVRCVRAATNRLLEMLGIERPPPSRGGNDSADKLLREFDEHLLQVAGLSRATVTYRVRYAGEMLVRLAVKDLAQLRAWAPAQVSQYVLSVGRKLRPSSGQVLASSIRSFLRFLLLRELIDRDLMAAVPAFANWRLASYPTTVGSRELQQLVAAADPSTPVGMRDRAILLCLTDLGLRAADLAALAKEDVFFASSVLRLRRPKQRDQVEVPMTARVAKAIRLYLRHGRPQSYAAALFVKHRAPRGGPLKPIGIRSIVVRRAAVAGLADQIRGTHVIRHSLASALINRGASIKQIADLLGHRCIDTTAIYAKVDLRTLSAVAMPWPTTRKPAVLP